MFRKKTKRKSTPKKGACTGRKRSTAKRKTVSAKRTKKPVSRTKKPTAKKRTVSPSGIKKVIRTLKSNIASLEKKVG